MFEVEVIIVDSTVNRVIMEVYYKPIAFALFWYTVDLCLQTLSSTLMVTLRDSALGLTHNVPH